jgi:hypothetical protein
MNEDADDNNLETPPVTDEAVEIAKVRVKDNVVLLGSRKIELLCPDGIVKEIVCELN